MLSGLDMKFRQVNAPGYGFTICFTICNGDTILVLVVHSILD